jgi:hypothetical protein
MKKRGGWPPWLFGWWFSHPEVAKWGWPKPLKAVGGDSAIPVWLVVVSATLGRRSRRFGYPKSSMKKKKVGFWWWVNL